MSSYTHLQARHLVGVPSMEGSAVERARALGHTTAQRPGRLALSPVAAAADAVAGQQAAPADCHSAGDDLACSAGCRRGPQLSAAPRRRDGLPAGGASAGSAPLAELTLACAQRQLWNMEKGPEDGRITLGALCGRLCLPAAAVRVLPRFTQLTYLSLQSWQLPACTSAALLGLPQLRNLHCAARQVPASVIDSVVQLTALTCLFFSGGGCLAAAAAAAGAHPLASVAPVHLHE